MEFQIRFGALAWELDLLWVIYQDFSADKSLLPSFESLPNPLRLKSRRKFRVRFLKPSLIFVLVTPSIGVVCERGNLSATEFSAFERLVVSNREVDEVN